MNMDLDILDACDVTYMVEYKSVTDGRWHLEYETDSRADALDYMLLPSPTVTYHTASRFLRAAL